MDRQREVRTLIIILITFIGVGVLFWVISSLISNLSQSDTQIVQEGEFESPSDESVAEAENSEEEEESPSGEDSEGEEGEGEEGSVEEDDQVANGGTESDLTEAEELFQEGILKAGETDKRLFLRFGAPWCPGCWQLSEFLGKPGVQKIYEQSFQDTVIDIDTVEGGQSLLKDLAGEGPKLPWYAIFDSSGQLIATSDSYEESIGFMPSSPEDREHFLSMFESSEAFSDEEMILFKQSIESYIEQNTR